MKRSKYSVFSRQRTDEFLKKLLRDLEKKGLILHETEDFETIISEAFHAEASEAGAHLLTELQTTAPEMLRERRKDMRSFEKRLNELWREPFDLLEIFLVISYEVGEEFNHEMRPGAAQNNDFVFDVLTRLHSRACQITGEILTLLRSGYAAGAHARWRTLHEVAVVAFFIKQHGNKVAERYLLHSGIESFKGMLEYQKYASTLGHAPFTEEEVEKVTTLRNQLCKKFGKSFGNRYGWAAEVLGKCDPTIPDLEREVNLDHYRPYYRMASHAVHANPKGVTFNLGLLPGTEEVLLAGPTNAGMADPAYATAISLHQTNTALLTTKPSLQGVLILHTMRSLVNEIVEAFLEVHKLVETQTQSQRQAEGSQTRK